MNTENKDIKKNGALQMEYYVPDKLLEIFKSTNFGKAILIAFIAHIVFVFIFSISYLLDVAFPERVKEREAKLSAATLGDTNVPGTAITNAATTNNLTNNVAANETGSRVSSVTSSMKSKEEALLEQHKDKEVVKEITQKADQKEIPQKPDLLSIFNDEKK